MINFVVATGSRWCRSGAVRFHMPSLPQKLSHAFLRPGVEATPILATEICGDMATETVVALDSNFKLLLMSRILVAVEKMVIARRGETTPSGVWHQQYTHNHVWSLKRCLSMAEHIPRLIPDTNKKTSKHWYPMYLVKNVCVCTCVWVHTCECVSVA